MAQRNSKSRSHLSKENRAALERDGGLTGAGSDAPDSKASKKAAKAAKEPPPRPTRRNSTEVRTTNRKGALLSARLTAANANRDLTALPNDAMREQINMQAQQEAILDWTPEAKWVDFLHVRAERAEQIAQEILKPTQRRR